MPRPSSRAWMVVCIVVAACSNPGEQTGIAEQAFCRGFDIANVVIDPTTFHDDDPHKLLTSAEGCGPRTLDVTVATSVSPSVSYTTTFTPTDSQLSAALGYSVTESIALSADSSVLVPLSSYARVDAYPSFQRATFQIVGLGCPGQVVVGTGTALKPVGVYFETCGVIGADPCGVGCVDGRPNDFAAGDAGAEGGPDAGAGTAGGPDAGAGAPDGG